VNLPRFTVVLLNIPDSHPIYHQWSEYHFEVAVSNSTDQKGMKGIWEQVSFTTPSISLIHILQATILQDLRASGPLFSQ